MSKGHKFPRTPAGLRDYLIDRADWARHNELTLVQVDPRALEQAVLMWAQTERAFERLQRKVAEL